MKKIIALLIAGAVLSYICYRLWGLITQGFQTIVLFFSVPFTWSGFGAFLLALLALVAGVAITGGFALMLILAIADEVSKK